VAAAPFDTLKLARALRDKAGFSQEHAEATADALADAVSEQVATKQDIRDVGTEVEALRSEIQAEFAAVRSEMQAEFAAVRSEMQAEFAAVRSEMQAEFAAVRSEMQAEFAAVRSEIAALRGDMVAGFRDVEQRMTIRLGGMLVVLAGILLAAKIFG
jgi:ABC-type phosphate transport system auxiliary subunit